MEQDIQNIPPNFQEAQLADIIRENINFQMDQSIKRTLLKESLLKISLDKDFQHLFQTKNHFPKIQPHHNQPNNRQKHLIQVSEEIKEICSWLEDSQQHRGAAYLPFHAASRLINILHQKVQGTIIIISEYPQFWMGKMQQMSRLSKLKWGFLSEQQDGDDKIKVLELYELKKLKVLFITPNLFRCQEYHQFECDLLIILDLHLYLNDCKYITQIINKTMPGRVLTLFHTLMPLHYKAMLTENNIVTINQPRANGFNFIVLKTCFQQKFKIMMAYLCKNEFKKVLIIVRKKQQASYLNKKLLLESKTSINMFEELSSKQINSFTSQSLLKQKQNKIDQTKIFQVLKKISHCDIVITKNTDFLRFCHFDIAVYYSFNDVISFTQSCFTVKQKLLLFEEADYCDHRNWITSDLVTMDSLQKLTMKLLERTPNKETHSKKRYYSDCYEDKLMNTFTVNKEFIEKDIQKVIRINYLCKKYQISQNLLLRIIESLQVNKIVSINYRTVYEIEIDLQSLARLKKEFPLIQQVRRKINLLNISTNLHKTIRSILEDFKKEGVRYKITEQAVQMKLLKDYDQINWQQLYERVNKDIFKEVYNLDKSFQIFKNCAYSSIELTRREKILHKKEYMLNFFGFHEASKQNGTNLMESYHKSNLLMSQIQEWIRVSQQVCIDEQELVLLLQGVDKGRISRFKEDAIFGRYRRLKYEQLAETISKIYNHKKIKIQ